MARTFFAALLLAAGYPAPCFEAWSDCPTTESQDRRLPGDGLTISNMGPRLQRGYGWSGGQASSGLGTPGALQVALPLALPTNGCGGCPASSGIGTPRALQVALALALQTHGCGGSPESSGIGAPSGRFRRYSQVTMRTSSHTCPSARKVSISLIQRFSWFSSR